MQGAQQRLFGMTFAPEDVVDCRVRRVRTRGVATAVALGALPTWLTLTLRDGRRFEARSRGPGPEQDDIAVVLDPITSLQLAAARDAMAAGRPHAFGPMELSAAGIVFRGNLTRWDDIAGFAARHGGFAYDDARGKLAGEVLLGDVPFGDALVAAVRERIPDRDYDGMSPGAGPRHGFFSITARTRVPGTFKYQLHVFLLGPLILVGVFGLYYVVHRARLRAEYSARERAPKPYVAGIPKASAALASAPVAPACTRDLTGSTPMLVSSDQSSVYAYSSYNWVRGSLDDIGWSSRFYVWSAANTDVHVVLWDESASAPRCHASAPVSAGASPDAVAQKLVLGWQPPPPPAPAPSVAVAPDPAAASAKPGKSGKPRNKKKR